MRQNKRHIQFIGMLAIITALLVSACTTNPSSTTEDEQPKIFTKEAFEKAIAEKGIVILTKEQRDLLDIVYLDDESILEKTTTCINKSPSSGSYIFVLQACKSTDNITAYGVPYKQVEFTQSFTDVDAINSRSIEVTTERSSPYALLQDSTYSTGATTNLVPPTFVAIYPDADTFTFTNTNVFTSSGVGFSDTITQSVTF